MSPLIGKGMSPQRFSRRVDDLLASKPGLTVAQAIALAADEAAHPKPKGNPCPDFWHLKAC